MWFWAAGCWFLMATDQAASLREGFRDLMTWLTGTSLLGDGALWWIMVYAFLWVAVGSRLVADMRPSRLSMAALLAAATAQGLALADRLGWIFVEAGPREVMFRAGSEMAGNLLLLAAMLVHARYVLLDAEGLLPHREQADRGAGRDDGRRSVRAMRQSPCLSSGGRWMKIDPPHATPQPAYQRPSPPRRPQSAAAHSPLASGSALSPVSRKLTKAERKALKERLLRERLERQRSG